MKAEDITREIANDHWVIVKDHYVKIIDWLGRVPVGCEFIWFIRQSDDGLSSSYDFFYPDQEVILV